METVVEELTERELEVLTLMAKGKSDPEIARELVIGKRTVYAHTHNIYRKLGVSGRVDAVVYALRNGLIKIEEVLDEEIVQAR